MQATTGAAHDKTFACARDPGHGGGQARAGAGAPQAAGDGDAGLERRVDQEPAGQGERRGEPGALVIERRLVHLHHERGALGGRRRLARPVEEPGPLAAQVHEAGAGAGPQDAAQVNGADPWLAVVAGHVHLDRKAAGEERHPDLAGQGVDQGLVDGGLVDGGRAARTGHR